MTGRGLSLAVSMYRAGRTFAEIGDWMGWPESTTRHRLAHVGGVTPRRGGPRRRECPPWHRRGLRRCLDCNAARMRESRARRRRGIPLDVETMRRIVEHVAGAS